MKPARKKLLVWEVRKLTSSPAKFLGSVVVADERLALKVAIKELNIRSADQKRLLILPHR